MSPLPCRGNLEALGVVVGGYLNLEGLRKHLHECRSCMSVYKVMTRAMAKATGARGGAAARGDKKRRGDRAHYQRLAARSWNRPA
jgi:hypothetical protein